MHDKVALVTGAGRGLGRAISLSLAREGARVIVNDLNAAAAQDVVAAVERLGRRAIAVVADTSDKSQVEDMVKVGLSSFGQIDILVNNAGIFIIGNSAQLDETRWRRGIDVDLTGVFFCSQVVGREMIERRAGKIVNLASMFGITAAPERACYCAAKAGVVNLTRSLACEWARYNINVNAIAPGYIRTEAFSQFAERGIIDEKVIAARIPAGVVGQPEDVANAVLFLASDESRYITGHTLLVDGGWTAFGFVQPWLDGVSEV